MSFIINPFRFAVDKTHQYYRLSIDSTTANGNGWYSNVKLYDAGGLITLTAGMVSNPGGALHAFSAAGLVDNDTAQDGFWLSGDEAGQTIDIDLGSGNARQLTKIAFTVENDGANNQAAEWSLFYSDNGTDYTDTTQGISITDDGSAMGDVEQVITL
jgi:hypothetical protein